MKLSLFGKTTALVASALALGFSAQADMVSITFVGAPTGVTNGSDYVMPYLLSVNGTLTDATCYDIFDNATIGESWTGYELTVSQAAASGQFSKNANALAGYEDVGFLSQQTTSSPQNQVDLQEDVWNVFAPGTYSVTNGMQAYLNLLTTPAFTNFDFNTVRFLEDVNQSSGRTQAFVIDPPAAAEPSALLLMGGGILLIALGRIKWRSPKQVPFEDGRERQTGAGQFGAPSDPLMP